MKDKVLYWLWIPVLLAFTGNCVLTRGECGEFAPFSRAECAANDSDATWTAHNIVASCLKYDKPLDKTSWPLKLKVENKFSATHQKNDKYQFLLNEGAAGYQKDVDVLFFLADGKVAKTSGRRSDVLQVFGDFNRNPSEDSTHSPEGWTIVITSEYKVEAILIRKALGLRWDESDPKPPPLPKWDDTKFNGGRTYESERD